MTPRTVLYVIVLLAIGVIVLANWATISQPIELNLLLARIEAPLGVLILLIAGAILAIDLLVHALSRRSWTLARRDLEHSNEELRGRADRSEESRIHALRDTLEREMATVRSQLDRVLANVESLRTGHPPQPAGDGAARARVSGAADRDHRQQQ